MPRKRQLSAAFCLGFTFLDNMAIAIVLPILPQLSAQLGAGSGVWIWIVAANGIALSVSPLMWGRIVSTQNTNRIITLTLLVKAFCVVGLLIPGQPWILLLLNRVLSGFMSGTTLAIQVWLVGNERTKRYEKPIAKMSIAGGLGVAGGSLLAIPILQANRADGLGPTLVFSLIAVFGVLVALGVIVWYLPTKHVMMGSSSPQVEEQSGVPNTIRETRKRTWSYASFAAPAIVTLNLFTRVTFFSFPVLFLLTAESSEVINAPCAAFCLLFFQ